MKRTLPLGGKIRKSLTTSWGEGTGWNEREEIWALGLCVQDTTSLSPIQIALTIISYTCMTCADVSNRRQKCDQPLARGNANIPQKSIT